MMSPDAEQQQHQQSDPELELVGFATGAPDARPRSSRRLHAHGNGDYHVVANDTPTSIDDAGGEEEQDDYSSHTSGEDEGLISQMSLERSSRFSPGNMDDYFQDGFSISHAEAAIDWRCAFWLVISFLLAALMAVVLPRFNNFGKPIVREDGTLIFPNGTIEPPAPRKNAVWYDCPIPETALPALNYHNTSVEESYINVTSQIDSNFSGFLETFHVSEFDGWGKPYDFVKAGMYHWKSTRYPKNLNDGDTIYESACGIGLNIIMTLEILKEVKGVSNLIVYGNEYLPSSVNTSNRVLESLLPPLNATKGSICAADSTNLYFIPSNSFDLVFTGYIR
jgi:hypothetical protein